MTKRKTDEEKLANRAERLRPRTPEETLLKEIEDAAGALVDLWALIEIGGCASRGERIAVDQRLRSAVIAIRNLRALSSHHPTHQVKR